MALLAVWAGCSDSANSGGSDGGTDSGGAGDMGAGSDGGTDLGGNPGGDGSMVSYTCAHEIHVSTTGDDSNAGTAASPLRTIAKATPMAQAGDCVKVHAGTYVEPSTIGFQNDGTASAPIVLWSVDGRGAAIIDAGGNMSGPTVLIHQDYVVVDGFEFRNSPINTGEQVVHFDGLLMGKCNGSVLRNCKITGGYDHIKVNQASNGVTVENNEFYGSFGHLPISLTGANNLVFRGNYCHDWNTGPDTAVQLKGGTHDALFDGNHFENITSQAGTIGLGDTCDTTCDIDPEHYAAVRARAINNLMVHVGRGFDLQGCKDCAVLSNTVVDSGVGTPMMKLTSASTNGNVRDTVNARILDNLIVNPNGDQGDIIQINGAAGMGLQMDYNLLWNGAAGVSLGGSHPSGSDTHSIQQDPTLAADHSPGPGSPAIGAGTNLFSDVPHDINGAARPSMGAFDIGAFQTH
jgi:hypothetical protein